METWRKAWVAAMLDSRAHIVTKNNKDRAAGSEQICLVLQTKHHEIAERLCAMTGTEPTGRTLPRPKQEHLRRQCTEHCPEAHVHVENTLELMPLTTTWTVTGVSAAVVLWNVRKYMATSREPWDWAMSQAFSQMKVTGRGSTATLRAVRRLDALGWEIPSPLNKLVPKELEMAT